VSLILTPTYTRYERYCDTLVRLMDRMWPQHPEIWFLTDGNGISYKNTIQIPNGNWTQVLNGGLKRIRSVYPDLQYAYLILEDLYPLWECDADTLAQNYGASWKAGLDLVLFYPPGRSPDIDGEVDVRGVQFETLASDFRYYTSLQPALWKFDYLMDVSEHALNRGVKTPWQFEFINLGRRHYKSSYDWPCAFSGLFHEGRVNLEAVRQLNIREFSGLRRRLMAEYVRQLPAHAVRTIAGKLSRGVTRAIRAVQ
jgi:hypothetical protein